MPICDSCKEEKEHVVTITDHQDLHDGKYCYDCIKEYSVITLDDIMEAHGLGWLF